MKSTQDTILSRRASYHANLALWRVAPESNHKINPHLRIMMLASIQYITFWGFTKALCLTSRQFCSTQMNPAGLRDFTNVWWGFNLRLSKLCRCWLDLNVRVRGNNICSIHWSTNEKWRKCSEHYCKINPPFTFQQRNTSKHDRTKIMLKQRKYDENQLQQTTTT